MIKTIAAASKTKASTQPAYRSQSPEIFSSCTGTAAGRFLRGEGTTRMLRESLRTVLYVRVAGSKNESETGGIVYWPGRLQTKLYVKAFEPPSGVCVLSMFSLLFMSYDSMLAGQFTRGALMTGRLPL